MRAEIQKEKVRFLNSQSLTFTSTKHPSRSRHYCTPGWLEIPAYGMDYREQFTEFATKTVISLPFTCSPMSLVCSSLAMSDREVSRLRVPVIGKLALDAVCAGVSLS
jgi:hypothetical protein